MAVNNNIVLIVGGANQGKSASLRNLENPEKVIYLNTDKKPLPFPVQFKKNIMLDHPTKILAYLDQINKQDSVDSVVLDTITFLMQMYERMCVYTSNDTRAAWGEYARFYGDFIDKIKSSPKQFAILGHEHVEYNETTLGYDSMIPVKGAVAKIGVEADFTTVLAARKVSTKQLEPFQNDLLHITDEEHEDEEKYVFMTRPYKGDGKITRSPLGLWERKELYIDNDIQQVFSRLNSYYSA